MSNRRSALLKPSRMKRSFPATPSPQDLAGVVSHASRGWPGSSCMLQHIDELLGRVVGRAFGRRPAREELVDLCRFLLVVRRRRQRALALAQQVVDQCQSAARRDRQHLMHAVGVEGSERGLRRIGGAQVEPRFAALWRTMSSPPVWTEGSAMTSVANMPASFSVSRWLTKKLPSS